MDPGRRRSAKGSYGRARRLLSPPFRKWTQGLQRFISIRISLWAYKKLFQPDTHGGSGLERLTLRLCLLRRRSGGYLMKIDITLKKLRIDRVISPR